MINIIHPGLYSSIQDQGRRNVSHLGVPISGAMDSIAANDANILLQNDKNCSLIECTIVGPKIEFNEETVIVITGALIQPFINGTAFSINTVTKVNPGDLLSFGRIIKGARFYIGIRGGFNATNYLGSQSVCITSSISSLLAKEDKISHAKYDGYYQQIPRFLKNAGNKKLNVKKGPDFHKLGILPERLMQIFNVEFEIGKDSNRMAYRVNNTINLSHTVNMISSGVIPGTVQITPDGTLIFLMRDAQTTGGYPRILQLSEKSVCDLAQLKAGDSFSMILDDQ